MIIDVEPELVGFSQPLLDYLEKAKFARIVIVKDDNANDVPSLIISQADAVITLSGKLIKSRF